MAEGAGVSIRRTMTTLATAVVGIVVLAASGAATPMANPNYHCRSQSYTYTRGHPRVWSSMLGPRIRSHDGQDQTLIDYRINALYELSGDNRLVNLTTPYTAGERLSRLLRITVTTAAGRTRSWHIGDGTTTVAKFGLKLSHGQVLASVNGSPGSTRRTPVLVTVVVAGRESCSLAQ